MFGINALKEEVSALQEEVYQQSIKCNSFQQECKDLRRQFDALYKLISCVQEENAKREKQVGETTTVTTELLKSQTASPVLSVCGAGGKYKKNNGKRK